MLDVYGNLYFLCKTPVFATHWAPNSLTPDWAPTGGDVPHGNNVAQLSFIAQSCVTPGTSYPVPQNTCPGLMGWFTVVWNACNLALAPGVPSPNGNTPTMGGTPGYNSPNVPAYLTPSINNPSFNLGTPAYLCGSIPQATGSYTMFTPGLWNPKGVSFRTTRCRRALDQFGRAADRCKTTTLPGNTDPLRYLASNLGNESPYCATN